MLEILSFAVGTGLIIWVSLPSLRRPGSYVYYRGFAWEAILGMFIYNARFWFKDPLSWHQVVSWILLIISLVLVVWGIVLLKRAGDPTDALEGTTRLVQTGIFKFIRHPLYSSLLFLAWGIFFKSPGVLVGCCGIIASAFLVATARADELLCRQKFGQMYNEYMNGTKMFIPFIF